MTLQLVGKTFNKDTFALDLKDQNNLHNGKVLFNRFNVKPKVEPLEHSEKVNKAKVGIFGCSHGNMELLEIVMREMRTRNVSKVIANGDFVNFFSGLDGLKKSLQIVHTVFPESSDPECNKNNVYIMPGNWDHNTIDSEEANEIMKEYGQLVVNEYDSFGKLAINGKKIQVAHFPQHPIPRKYLPPDEYLYCPIETEAHFFGTMSQQINDLSSVDLNIIGHSHIHTHFYDENSKVLTYSPGGLSDRKKPEEKKGFGIYDTETGFVITYSVEKDMNGDFEVAEISSYCDHIDQVCSGSNDIFNIKDPKICDLDYRRLSECAPGIKDFNHCFLDAFRPVTDSTSTNESIMEKEPEKNQEAVRE